jgi:hypothetical protein
MEVRDEDDDWEGHVKESDEDADEQDEKDNEGKSADRSSLADLPTRRP